MPDFWETDLLISNSSDEADWWKSDLPVNATATDTERLATKESLQQQQAKAASEASPLKEKALGALESITEIVSRLNPLTAVPRFIYGVEQGLGIIPKEQPFPLEQKTQLAEVPKVTTEDIKTVFPNVNEKAAGVIAGSQQAVGDFLNFFLTPEGISTLGAGMAPKAAQAALGAGFSGAMASNVPEAASEAGRLTVEGTTEEAARAIGGLAGQVALPGVIAAAGAPATAKALEQVVKPEMIKPEIVQPLGIAPPGTSVAQKVIEYFKPPPESSSPPPIQLDVSTPLPDLQPKPVANEIFSQPFAIERLPIIGRLLGGRARIRNEKDQSVAAWYAERHGIGPAIASAVGEQIKGRINAVFKADEVGNLNVTPKGEGQSLKISDVFEELQRNPDSYTLTAEQRTVFNEIMQPISGRERELVAKYELVEDLEAEGGYFSRIVTERPAEDAGKLGGGRRVGAKQSFQKERAFESEAEGWEKGYKYETDVEKRIVTGIERIYRAIADKRLATDPALGGKTRSSLLSELREAYAEELGSGEMTDAKLERIADGLQSKGTVWQPGFFGRIFDAETANMLNKEFAAEQSHVRRALANTNDFLKALRLGFDVGIGQIQLLPTLFRNPTIWAEAQWKSFQAMLKPEVFSEYARQNEAVISEMAQMGSSVGRLPEMLAGMTGPTISKVPGLKQAAAPFARQFQTALDVAKIELWKAGRETVQPGEWFKYIQAIESQLQSARMESSMVSHGRALSERVLFLAPSYYRGALNLLAGLSEKGAGGTLMRQAMGSFVAGSVALYVAGAYLIGMDEDEIQKRLDPTQSNFMLWKTRIGERDVNIGFGGIFRSFLRLAGNVAKTSSEHPENWKSLSPDKNPLSRWYRGHAGPTVGLVWDQFSGRDFLGEKANLEKLPSSVAPLWMQELISRQKGQPPVTLAEIGASFTGLQAYPESLRRQYQAERETLAKAKHGKPFEELKLREQLAITREVNKRPVFAEKPQASQRMTELSMEAQAQREERLSNAIKAKEAIQKAGLRVRGYDPVLTIGKTKFALSETQREQYETLIVEQYDRRIGLLLNSKGFAKMHTPDQQKLLDRQLEQARSIAKARLIRELNK